MREDTDRLGFAPADTAEADIALEVAGTGLAAVVGPDIGLAAVAAVDIVVPEDKAGVAGTETEQMLVRTGLLK
ncbi:MAG: hypothetical protein JO097_11580 [Acidobacteriaceae bacterium]|nr:hypothetical protein [Acidobacteriaceae bacterium]